MALGTMGECATVSQSDYESFVDCLLKTVRGRIPTFVGTTALGGHEIARRDADELRRGGEEGARHARGDDRRRDDETVVAQAEQDGKPGIIIVVCGIGGIDFVALSSQWALPRAGVRHEVREFSCIHTEFMLVLSTQDTD